MVPLAAGRALSTVVPVRRSAYQRPDNPIAVLHSPFLALGPPRRTGIARDTDRGLPVTIPQVSFTCHSARPSLLTCRNLG